MRKGSRESEEEGMEKEGREGKGGLSTSAPWSQVWVMPVSEQLGDPLVISEGDSACHRTSYKTSLRCLAQSYSDAKHLHSPFHFNVAVSEKY